MVYLAVGALTFLVGADVFPGFSYAFAVGCFLVYFGIILNKICLIN